jgi:hypothetical protein
MGFCAFEGLVLCIGTERINNKTISSYFGVHAFDEPGSHSIGGGTCFYLSSGASRVDNIIYRYISF